MTHQMPAPSDAAATLETSSPKPVSGATVKGQGVIAFRSGTVRDLAAVLDTNPDVRAWSICKDRLGSSESGSVPDLRMVDQEGVAWFLDAPDRPYGLEAHLEQAARQSGARYRRVRREEIYSGFRLRNARDLLRYANYTVSLADRIRLLATLDEQGSLPMADCLSVIRAAEPVAAIASLMLYGFVDADLDEALLGPETMVRRIRS